MMQGETAIPLFLPMLVICIGAVAVISGANDLSDLRRQQTAGETARGVVENVWGGGKKPWGIRTKFKDPSGRDHAVNLEVLHSYEVGQSVDLHYVPDQPEIIHVHLLDEFYGWEGRATALVAAGLVFVSGGSALIAVQATSTRRQRRNEP